MIVIEPNKSLRFQTLPNGWDETDLQPLVGGFFTAMQPPADMPDTIAVCNEEGIPLHLEYNPVASRLLGMRLAGTVVLLTTEEFMAGA